MVTKYYSKDCLHLLNTQASLQTQDGTPFNPVKWELMQKFPQYFQHHFFDKYPKEERLIILEELATVYQSKWEKIKYLFQRVLRIDQRLHSFDRKDYKEYAKTYLYALYGNFGLMTINQVREKMGFEEFEGGDDFIASPETIKTMTSFYPQLIKQPVHGVNCRERKTGMHFLKCMFSKK